MKALILGAAGQLGVALQRQAPPHWTCHGATRSRLDLNDRQAIVEAIDAIRPDLVFNAAAHTAVDRAESEPAMAFAVNAEALGVLAKATRERGAHLVHFSTDFVFDGNSARAYLPGDARNPLSVYGRSKAAGEDAAGSSATVIRTSWVYDAGSVNFVTTMLRLMRDRDEVRVVADQIGAPTWAGGLADVAWALGSRRLPGIWHFSDAGVASWYDFAVAIAEEATCLGLLERSPPIVPIGTAHHPTPATRPRFSLLDSSRTLSTLGLPAIHWRMNLRRMLAELRARREEEHAADRR